jgi:OFA family oxalate/formate antiporter-like MFS transporter
MPQSTPMRRERPWAAIAAATCINLPLGSLYAFSVFLKPMEQLFAATRSELSIVFALATISFTVGMNAAPRLYRAASAPVLVAACAACSTLGIVLTAGAGSLTLVMMGYGVLFGLGGGIAYIVVQQGVNLMVRSHKGLINGYIVGLYPAGAMIAAPVFGWAIGLWGLRVMLAGLATTLAVTGLVSIWLVVHAGVRLQTNSAGPPPPAGRALIFWQMWTVFFLAAAAGLTVLSQAAGIIAAYGGSTALALFATTAITGAIAAARLGGGWLVDRFSIPFVMAFAHALALSGTILLTLWPDPLVSAVTLAMIGMGYGFISGSSAAAVACYWPSSNYGRIASRLYIAWCVAAVSLPVLAGHLFDVTGGYRAVVIIAGCGNLLGIAIALTLPRQGASAIAV